MLKYALLGFLNYEPMTGYDLKQKMDASTACFWHAETSQIYTTLKKLEAEELVVSELHPQTDRPDRRLYTITDAGREDLRAWLMQPITDLPPFKEGVLMKLFFSAQVEREALLTQLRLLRNQHERQIAYYRN